MDAQHAPTDYTNMAAMVTAANAGGCHAVVRVAGPGDRPGIQQARALRHGFSMLCVCVWSPSRTTHAIQTQLPAQNK